MDTTRELSIKEVLAEWYQRVTATQNRHDLAAKRFSRLNYILGIPVIALATIVGVALLVWVNGKPYALHQIMAGLAAVAVAILASLQTFLGLADRGEKHRVAAAKYGAVRREIEMLLGSTRINIEERLESIRRQLNALDLESPVVPEVIYQMMPLPRQTAKLTVPELPNPSPSPITSPSPRTTGDESGSRTRVAKNRPDQGNSTPTGPG